MKNSAIVQEVERRKGGEEGEEEMEEEEGKSHRRSLVLRGGDGEQSCNVSRCFSIALKQSSFSW